MTGSAFIGGKGSEQSTFAKDYFKEGGFDVVFGDSIANGCKIAGGLSGDTKIGRNPEEILKAIKGYDPEEIKGKKVLLSTGASNNYYMMKQIREEIRELKKLGAERIIVLGVGPGKDGEYDTHKVNANLAKICREEGVTFTGPLKGVSNDQVHPSDYRTTLKTAEAALKTAPPVPAKNVAVKTPAPT